MTAVDTPYPIAWEGADGRGLRGFLRTFVALVVDARAFSGGFPPGTIRHAAGFFGLVELLWSAASVAMHAARAEHPLADDVVATIEIAGALLVLVLGTATFAHLVARGTRPAARWGDAFRGVAYASAAYCVLRIPSVVMFALRLERKRHFAGVAFVLWLAPVVFGIWFAVRAVRARYQCSLARTLLGVVMLPVLAVLAVGFALYGVH